MERYEKSDGYGSGPRISYSDLSLRNICGNIIEDSTEPFFDYEGYQIRHFSWKGPLHWLPRRKEIDRFIQVAESVAEPGRLPTVLEVGAGTGLLSFLLAETNRAQITAMDPYEQVLLLKTEDIPPAYTHPNLELITGTMKSSVAIFETDPPDVVISSWMPKLANFTRDIVSLRPKAIIYVYPNDQYYEKVLTDEYGIQYGKRFVPKKGYRRGYTWLGIENSDVTSWWMFVNSERTDKKGLIRSENLEFFGRNFVEIHLRNDVPELSLTDSDSSEFYSWENPDLAQVLDPETYANFLKKPEKLVILQEGLNRLLKVEPSSRLL